MVDNKEKTNKELQEKVNLNSKEKGIVSTICIVIAVLIATLPIFYKIFGYWNILLGIVVGLALEFLLFFIIKMVKYNRKK